MHLAKCSQCHCLHNGISLKDLRLQFYDNASNMSGKYIDMQAIINEHNQQGDIFLV